MTHLLKDLDEDHVLPEKIATENICCCDCLPCRRDGECSKCDLGKAQGYMNGDMCHEGDNSEYAQPYNACLSSIESIALEPQVLVMANELFKFGVYVEIYGTWENLPEGHKRIYIEQTQAIASNPSCFKLRRVK